MDCDVGDMYVIFQHISYNEINADIIAIRIR